MSTQSKYFNQLDSNDIKGGLYTVDSMLDLYKMNATTHFKDGMICYITKYKKYYRYVKAQRKWWEINIEMIKYPDASVTIDGETYDIFLAGLDYDQLLQELIQLKYSVDAQANLDLNMRKYPDIYYEADKTFHEWVDKCRAVAWQLIYNTEFPQEYIEKIFDYQSFIDLINDLYEKVKAASEADYADYARILNSSLYIDGPNEIIYNGQESYTFSISAHNTKGEDEAKCAWNTLVTADGSVLYDSSTLMEDFEVTIDDLTFTDYTFYYELYDSSKASAIPVHSEYTISFKLPYYIGASPRTVLTRISNIEASTLQRKEDEAEENGRSTPQLQSHAADVNTNLVDDSHGNPIVDETLYGAGEIMDEPLLADADKLPYREPKTLITQVISQLIHIDISEDDWDVIKVSTKLPQTYWQQFLTFINREYGISLLSSQIDDDTVFNDIVGLINNELSNPEYVYLDWYTSMDSSIDYLDYLKETDSLDKLPYYEEYAFAEETVIDVISEILMIEPDMLKSMITAADEIGQEIDLWGLLYTADMQKQLIDKLNMQPNLYVTSLQTAGDVNNLIANVYDMAVFAQEDPDNAPLTYFEDYPITIYPSAVNGMNELNLLKYQIDEDEKEPEDHNPLEEEDYDAYDNESVMKHLTGNSEGAMCLNLPPLCKVNIPIDGWYVWVCVPENRRPESLRLFANGFIFPLATPIMINGTFAKYYCYRSKWPLGLYKATIPLDIDLTA